MEETDQNTLIMASLKIEANNMVDAAGVANNTATKNVSTLEPGAIVEGSNQVQHQMWPTESKPCLDRHM